jgi:DNA-binding transcriptional regulator YdaS (Cro superfamily)
MDVNDVVQFFGTASEAARRLGVTRAAVSIWQRRGIPPGRQALIQLQTRGKLRAEDQRLVPKIDV